MLNSWLFLVFVLASLVLYWLVIPSRMRPWFLALASFTYFLWFSPESMLFLLALSVLVYGAGAALRNRHWKPLMTASVTVLVGLLLYIKYRVLLCTTLGWVLDTRISSGGFMQIAVPLGISYFTFKMIHYLIDSYRDQIETHTPGEFAAYIFYFPILVSGPIERFQPFLEQLRTAGRFDTSDLTAGLPRIVSGLFKKLVLADTLAAIAVLLQEPDLAGYQYWMASLAYTLQLYFDFAGYSDIAIGVSRLFGITVMENFNWPYLAPNLSHFWKRWHMSLTGWFRDYLFIPLGGSRGTLAATIKNTLIVMAITGLWHGAGWHFVFWGLFHGAGLVVMRLYRKFVLPRLPAREWLAVSPVSKAFSIVLTFSYVNIGWIFFACEGNQSMTVLAKMFGIS